MLLLTIFIVTLTSQIHGKRFYITSTGACTDCQWTEDKKYQWCNTDKWDYCSTSPGYSSENKKCKSDHPCDLHDYGYMWCWLEEGGWDYCSYIEDTTVVQHNFKGEECQNYCDLNHFMYRCRTSDHKYESCSLANEVNSEGKGCREESSDNKTYCGFHGYEYKWCRSTAGSWGYCSDEEFDSSALESDVNGTRQRETTCDNGSGGQELSRSWQLLENGYRLVTIVFRERPDPTIFQPTTRSWLTDARTVLYRWHAGLSSDRPLRFMTEQSNGQIRLDRQGRFENDLGRFDNWQLQINDVPVRPSTIARVNILTHLQGFEKRGYNRILVRALHRSMEVGAKVWVFQQHLAPGQDAQCPRQ